MASNLETKVLKYPKFGPLRFDANVSNRFKLANTSPLKLAERWQRRLVRTDVHRVRAFNSDRSGDAVGYAVAFVQRRTCQRPADLTALVFGVVLVL